MPGISDPGVSAAAGASVTALSVVVVSVLSFVSFPPQEAKNIIAATAGTKNNLFMVFILFFIKKTQN
jgi:hypothetical protein